MKFTSEQEELTWLEGRMKDQGKSQATIDKYRHDVGIFLSYMGEGRPLSQELLENYKQDLGQKYAVASANSMLAAVNYYLREKGWGNYRIRAFKIPQMEYRDKSKDLQEDEYIRLLETAKKKGMMRLYFVIRTICTTGIRIGELPSITMEALRAGVAEVELRGKRRKVLLPSQLCGELLEYSENLGITQGSVFITRNGRPIDRSNILHEMKSLCKEANVDSSKVFPYNLRHFFAVSYYKENQDVCGLADALGHASLNTTRVYTLSSNE